MANSKFPLYDEESVQKIFQMCLEYKIVKEILEKE